jgi:hypothetical protein
VAARAAVGHVRGRLLAQTRIAAHSPPAAPPTPPPPPAGAAFILGINLHSEDPDLAAAQIKRIQEVLPPESILSFAVG